MWWVFVVGAVVTTITVALITAVLVQDLRESRLAGLHLSDESKQLARSLAVFLLPGTLMWTAVLRSWGWWSRPHTPWRRTLDLEVEGTYARVLAGCSRALQAVGAHVIRLDLDRGLIEAQTSTTILGWGERITFGIKRSAQSLCTIALESDCLNPVQISDFGKNAKNLRLIAEVLVQ